MEYAKGSVIKDVNGKEYIDFFCGAGALNYGHNNDYINEIEIRGIGFIWGIEVHNEINAKEISKKAFENGLIVERAGRNNSIVKIMPALTIDDDTLIKGLNILKKIIKDNM